MEGQATVTGAAMRLTRLGVIDLGSNSGRLILALRQIHGIPLIVDESQVSLRLAERLQQTGEIGRPACERARQALRGFKAAAEQFGVERLIVVGTSALRDATNGAAVIKELQCDTGVEVALLSGEREAYYGYLAAVNSLPIFDGVVLDLGGGSLELSFVKDRACERALSLPLGALRMSERFLTADPPTNSQIADLKEHVTKSLRQAGVRKAKDGVLLVGSGGTVRNLAKLVRKSTDAPPARLHGYVVEGSALRTLTRSLLSQSVAQRRRIPGLPPDRADIITGGAVVVQAAMEAIGARSLLVCGQGIREGVAMEAFRAGKAPLIRNVRRAGVDAFRERYVTGALRRFTHEDLLEPGMADHHPSDGVEPLALRLLDRLGAILPATPTERELLDAAAALSDAGHAVSLYRWPEHAAYLLTNGDLTGFTQPEATSMAMLIAAQAGQRLDARAYGPDGQDGDGVRSGRLGFVVGLARWLRRVGVDAATPLSVMTPPGALIVVLPPGVPLLDDEWKEGLARGCRRYFDRELLVTSVGD